MGAGSTSEEMLVKEAVRIGVILQRRERGDGSADVVCCDASQDWVRKIVISSCNIGHGLNCA